MGEQTFNALESIGAIDRLERVANTLRGMGFDRRIPADTLECIARMTQEIDAIVAFITESAPGYDYD